MPRKPRIISSTGIYHIVLRSVNQHIIFEEDADFQKFLYLLSDCKMKYDLTIYAYCLMNNHIHLLLKSAPENLSRAFQSLGTKFVRWYNTKYVRTGHLFQERFYSTPIENDRAFLAVLIYIHNNPVSAEMCRYPSEYRWSSYNSYYGQKNLLIDTTFAYEIAGTKEQLYAFFMRDYDAGNFAMDEREFENKNHFCDDKKALSIFKSVTNLTSTSEAAHIPREERNLYVRVLRKQGLTVKQIARLMDISTSTVKRLCK